jgi:A/G-specific adenine glycosylase
MDEVLSAWAGLGYYARARNLHACARIVNSELDGRFPSSEKALQRLPGIGPYTAAAIAAIAFGQSATVVDSNVERVMSRIYAVRDRLPEAKKELRSLASALTPQRRPGDYAQAVMDLGATVCMPRKPKCDVCPWRGACQGYALGIVERLPRRVPKSRRPTRRGVTFWAVRSDGAVLLRRRASRGLLGGMMEFPSTDWVEFGVPEQQNEAPLAGNWRALPGMVRHTFTHFHLELTVMVARVDGTAVADGVWVTPDMFGVYALPSLMRKVAHHAISQVTISD